MIPLHSFSFWSSISIFRFLFRKPFITLFISALAAKRDYPLTGFLSALILQKIFSIPMDSLLILLLKPCKELRVFCGFSKVPDAPLFTRFKLGFEDYIELMFQQMVDYTEPICQQIHSSLAQILTFDTSGIELYVTENNPKTLNALIRKLKAYYKDNPILLMKINPLVMPLPSNRCFLFFSLHPDFHPDTFLGNFSFDTSETYGMLLNDFHFSKALIPYNPRNESTLKKIG